MECVGLVLALIFFSLLFLNVPVAVAIGSATMLGVAVAGGTFRPEIIVPERMMFGINSVPLPQVLQGRGVFLKPGITALCPFLLYVH